MSHSISLQWFVAIVTAIWHGSIPERIALWAGCYGILIWEPKHVFKSASQMKNWKQELLFMVCVQQGLLWGCAVTGWVSKRIPPKHGNTFTEMSKKNRFNYSVVALVFSYHEVMTLFPIKIKKNSSQSLFPSCGFSITVGTSNVTCLITRSRCDFSIRLWCHWENLCD